MIIEPNRPDPFEAKVDSVEVDENHRALAECGYRLFANVTSTTAESLSDALEKARKAGYTKLVWAAAYDDRGVQINGANSLWVKR